MPFISDLTLTKVKNLREKQAAKLPVAPDNSAKEEKKKPVISPINIGYEVECISPLNSDQIRKQFEDMGMPARVGGNHTGPYDKWIIATDGSVYANRGGTGHELISPIMDLEKGLEILHRVFTWLHNHRGYTNDTCGFHVGVSMKDRVLQAKLDPLKLCLLFDEGMVTRSFGREGSRWCRSVQDTLKALVQQHAGSRDPVFRALSVEEKLRRLLPREKFYTVNLTKLPNYIEFRCMGGDYSTKFANCAETIRYYGQCIQAACTPGMLDDIYLPKLEAVIGIAKKKFKAMEEEMAKEAERLRLAKIAEAERIALALKADAKRRLLRTADDRSRRKAERRKARGELEIMLRDERIRAEIDAADQARLGARADWAQVRRRAWRAKMAKEQAAKQAIIDADTARRMERVAAKRTTTQMKEAIEASYLERHNKPGAMARLLDKLAKKVHADG